MATIDLVREETGLDLSNAKLSVDLLAPQFAARVNAVLGDLDRAIAVAKKIFDSYKSISAANATPLAVYTAAYNAAKDGIAWIQGQAAKKADESLKRRAATRNEYLRDFYGLPFEGKRRACWAMVGHADKAPTPAELDLTKGAAQDPGKHLSQYDPRQLVFHVSRVGLSQVLNPTWSVPPYDIGGDGPWTWGNGVQYLAPTLLGGHSMTFGVIQTFYDRPPATAGIPAQYQDKYWGNKPGGGSISPPNPSPKGDYKFDWSPIDAAIFTDGYAPVPDYFWLFSLGTYPYTGWQGAPGGDPVAPVFDLSGYGATMAGAMHSLTPIHAQITWSEVAECYRHFLKASGFRNLLPLPDGQVDFGVFLDTKSSGAEFLLPVSVSTTPGIPIPATHYKTEMVREIELAFRRWFALRRVAIYDFARTPESFKVACKTSPDPILRELAKGGNPPPFVPWNIWDPLGDGFAANAQPPPPPPPGLDKGAGPKKPGGGIGIDSVGGLSSGEKPAASAAGPVLVAGAAAAAAYFLLR